MRIWLLTKESSLRNKAQRGLMARAAERGIELIPVMADAHVLRLTSGDLEVLEDGAPLPLPDAAINYRCASGNHVVFSLTRQLEAAGVPVFNSTEATLLGRDKAASLQRVAAAGLPVPRTWLVPLSQTVAAPELPIVVKTAVGSRGAGVFLCRDQEAYQEVIASLREELGPHHAVLLQEYVPSLREPAQDLRIYVVGGEALGAILREAGPDEWKTNLATGGSASEVSLDPEAGRLASEACRLLGLDLGGVDLLVGEDGYRFSEVNPAPLFHVSEEGAARTYDVPNRLYDLIETRLRGPAVAST